MTFVVFGVSFHEIGFENSYFAAAVLMVFEESLFVMYEALVDVNDDPYQEEVKLQDIRPYPPTVRQRLTVGDDVEVWDHQGWFRGKVLMELEQNLSIYYDYRGHGERHAIIPRYDVRIHQEWMDCGVGGLWTHNKV